MSFYPLTAFKIFSVFGFQKFNCSMYRCGYLFSLFCVLWDFWICMSISFIGFLKNLLTVNFLILFLYYSFSFLPRNSVRGIPHYSSTSDTFALCSGFHAAIRGCAVGLFFTFTCYLIFHCVQSAGSLQLIYWVVNFRQHIFPIVEYWFDSFYR